MADRMTADELRATLKTKGTPRVKNAQRTEVDGIKFDSKAEAARWAELKLLERSGWIANLERQVKIPLMGRDGPILTPKGRPMHYVADFQYRENDALIIEDKKAGDFRTEVYQIKRAILAAQGIIVRET